MSKRLINRLEELKENFLIEDWEELTKLIPELDSIKKGTWVTDSDNTKFCFRYTKERDNYGFNGVGQWSNSIGTAGRDRWVEVNKKGVLKRLKIEALNRGYNEGVLIKSFVGDTSRLIREGLTGLEGGDFWYFGCVIMRDGEWAKILQEKLPVINGYEGVLTKGGDIKYGCATLKREWFEGSISRRIESLTLNSGVEIKADQMKAIRVYLKHHNK